MKYKEIYYWNSINNQNIEARTYPSKLWDGRKNLPSKLQSFDEFFLLLFALQRIIPKLQPHKLCSKAVKGRHSDLNDQILFHSTIDALPGVPGVSKNRDDQTGVHSGELER